MEIVKAERTTFGGEVFCPWYLAWVSVCRKPMLWDDRIFVDGSCKECRHMEGAVAWNRARYWEQIGQNF
jgi:hypothetical protein